MRDPRSQVPLTLRADGQLRGAMVCLLLLLIRPAGALQVEARLETDSVQLGEAVRLVLETDAKPADPPGLRVLERDFRILRRESSSSFSFINGRRTERYQIMLTLSPRRAGLLEIPSIRFGEASTAPIQLAVGDGPEEYGTQPAPNYTLEPAPYPRPAYPTAPPRAPGPSTDADAGAAVDLLEASIQPPSVRVAQQALLVARVLMPSPVTGPGLQAPRIEGARLLPLGEDWDQVRRGGVDYRVYERRYALFPNRIGRLDIDPLVFDGWRPGAADGRYPSRPARASSKPLKLEVLPAADGEPGVTWLPARDLRLDETGPDTYQVRVGQALDRVIDIRADGISAADLPGPATSTPQELEERRGRAAFWDERTPSGIIGTRRETIRLTAREPGRFRLPALSMSWWDTDTGEWKTAGLRARELVALPMSADEPARPPIFEPIDTRDTWIEAGPEPNRSDQAPPGEESVERQDGEPASGFWIWATAALGLAWLITMTVWWTKGRGTGTGNTAPSARKPNRIPEKQPPALPDNPMTRAIGEVRLAYESGEAGAARAALLAWAALALPEQRPANLALLAKRCHEPLRGEILLLEQSFFSPHPVHWERREVWERLPGFEPVPAQQPASFRRKKPLRRQKPSPDITA